MNLDKLFVWLGLVLTVAVSTQLSGFWYLVGLVASFTQGWNLSTFYRK